MKYRIYIDETGNPDMKASSKANHRFLCLTGVIIELGYAAKVVTPKIEALKSKYFESHPDTPLIFHRKEMVQRKYPFQRLNDPDIRARFDEELLSFLSEIDYTVISVCIDKKNHLDTYQNWHLDPYHYCLEVLLERYSFYLGSLNSKGDVMAESRGGKEDMRLKREFSKLHQDGTHYVSNARLQSVLTSKQLKVKTKGNNIAGLQVADLVAHSSRNEILHEQDLLETKLSPFALKLIPILQQKYYRKGNRVFGKKFI